MPRGKHIRTVAHGLWQQPTNLNNVETLRQRPVDRQPRRRRLRGAWAPTTSKGTKIFSLTGKARNSGLVEVPMGATLREVIFDVGGGMQDGREFKAVQLGGPSGGCLPADLLDTPIDFENLTQHGSMMGSGGMVVVDDSTCMVDFAKFFFEFTAEESCGKCVPCRVGTQRVLEILERICAGEGTLDDVELLEQLSDDIIEGSLCQLGGSAPNPVLTTLRYFRDEVDGARGREALPGQGVPAAHQVLDRRGRLHGLPRLLRGLPHAGDQRRAQAAARDRPEALHQVRYLPSGVQVRRHPRRGRATGAGRREAAVSPRTKAAVQLTVDGRQLTAREGETVLDVARREGIDIPALCHQEGMAAWGACRLCMVEVEGLDKLQAACTTWVKDGQVVKTDTKRVRARRESYLKMYLSDHNAYCEAPCSHACPTHIDIPAYMAALASGDAAGAASHRARRAAVPRHPRARVPALLRARVPPRRRGRAHRHLRPAPGGRRPQRQRCWCRACRPAGGSPSSAPARPASPPPGSSRRRGHEVTIYDANEEPGGSLRYSIPEFRLPGKVVEKELTPLWDAGVRFVGESELGYEVDPDGLFDAGFDAVIISVGTWEEPRHVLPGDDAAVNGLELLKRVREGRAVKFTQKVAVIGDGITAFDVARTARRKGAKEVVVIAQHEADDIPAGARELAAALDEGVKVEFGALAKKVKAKAGKAQGVECVRVVREKGRRKEVRGSRFEIAATTVVMATGYAPRLGDSADYLPLADSRLIANYYTGRTPEEGVFAAGDAITGSQSAIHAVAGGKRSALAVDAWLRGEDLEQLEERLAVFNGLPYLDQLKDEAQLGELGVRLAERTPVWLKMGASAESAARATMPKVGKQKRLTATDLEVEKGYSLAAARAEATRCLQCECPSNGACDLQTLGVEYDITDNELVVKGNLVREVEPQYEHPFIRRDMSRCIACGKCVRVCRDVAGPACYDFTGRGFTINVDTPYSDALQLADCISCGRCVTACPTGALTFNERELASFRVDESRCILCHECVDVCPVDALKDTNHFEDARDQVARARLQGQRAGRRSPHVRRLRRPDRRAPDPHGHGRPGRRLRGHRLPRGEHHHLPVHLVEGQLHPHRLRELGRDALAASRPRTAPSRRRASSRRTPSSSPSAATAAPTTSACSRSPAPWSAATRCCTSATTTAPT